VAQDLNRPLPDLAQGLSDGGQAGEVVAGDGDVVVADHGERSRDGAAEVVASTDRPEGDEVVGGEDGRDAWVAGKELVSNPVAAVRVRVALADQVVWQV
jgi:hypothetical protein